MIPNDAYRAAERRIATAKKQGAIELDLSVEFGENRDASRLTELPESVGEIPGLQGLNLRGNALAVLPEWLGRLTQLRSLRVSSNQLTILPESLGRLTQLRSLDLNGNRLTVLPEQLGQLKHLQSLSLSSNNLKSLPESVRQLEELQSLNLVRNEMIVLPESLGRLTQLRSLDLSHSRLGDLPEWVGNLKKLESLHLRYNRLESLPQSMGLLTNIRVLNLGGNRLGKVPELLRQMPRLSEFWIWKNGLTEIPEWFGDLKALTLVGIHVNNLTYLPNSFAKLAKLRHLTLGLDGLGGNPLRGLPDCIRSLTQLHELAADGCEIATLPHWLIELEHLHDLSLDRNPLVPPLAVAYKEGLDAVKGYLREMAKGGKGRYEAKLLILGDGNEGKTCVSRALRSMPFRIQKTTRGVDVVQWAFSHPDHEGNREKDITLNIWDFEGQEITHQTHQFFLTSQSLYLLVFKCRDQFLMERAEYWMDTIRARAPEAKVVIVISQCEARSPHIPLDRIEAQYREMLAEEWFFPVGCENGKNVEKLGAFLRRSAAKLEFMGSPWPNSYEKAESQLKKKANAKASYMSRANLHSIFRKAGVSQDNYEGAAAAFERLGVITQFTDSPDLRDFVVLKPQWLTKAISTLMENGQLADDKGEIALKRMESIWSKGGYSGMFATFHDCMKEFELCYDLEDQADSCLIPLRFGYLAPTIPWTCSPALKQRRIEYKLNIRPPMGIMSRFIVKTHHMIVKTTAHPKGVYWHNGVFLRTSSPVPSEALCEFIPDERIFRVQVRAAFPQNMCEQIHGYIQAVFSFFGGLEAERSYGCIKVNPETGIEDQCKGLHTERRIYTAIARQRELLDCEFEEHEVDPRVLVGGFSSFSDFVKSKLISIEDLRRELDHAPEWAAPFVHGIATLIKWAHFNSDKLDELLHAQDQLSAEFKQEAELKLHEYLACTSRLLDDRDYTAAPGLMSITTKDRSPWNPLSYFKQTFVLTPFCECEGNIHACPDGNVQFTKDSKWWATTAPWIARATKFLSAGLQLAFAGMPLALGSDAAKLIEDEVKLMEALTEHLELEAPKEGDMKATDKVLSEALSGDPRTNDRETAVTRAALARFLEELAPVNYRAHRWGSLSRTRMSDNSYRWLCDECAKTKH